MQTRARVAVVAAVAIGGAAAAGSVSAHDFWLVPQMFSVATAEEITVRGQTSSLFPTSVSAVTPDRVVEARVVTADRDTTVRSAAVVGTSLRLGFTPGRAGQHLVAVRLAPRSLRESPESFRRYLDLEGAPEARLRYEREGRLPPLGGDSITRRYAKYAKTFVQVGRGAKVFDRVLNHPLEIVPLNDPSSLRSGDTLRIRLLLLSESLAGAKLHAGAIPIGSPLDDTTAARGAARRDTDIETDASGIARLVVGESGTWNLRTIQIVPAARGSGADWDVHWATITFGVGGT